MENVKKIELEDIIKIASGTDVDGLPHSAMMLAIDEVKEDKMNKIEEVFLEDAVLDLHMSGGAAVLVVDFPKKSHHIFRKLSRICKKWLADLKEESEVLLNQLLTMTVTPYLLQGQIFLVFNQLIYAYGCEHKEDNNSFYRLILAFDNLETGIYTSEGIDAGKIIREAEMEMKRYEEELDNDIALAMEEEQKAIREINELELGIQDLLKTSISDFNEDEKQENDS